MTTVSWVALILGIVIPSLLVVAIGVIALRALQSARETAEMYMTAHAKTLQTLETVHSRNMKQLDSLLDRFMALDFQLFKAYQDSEEPMVGGFEAPDDDLEQNERLLGTMTYTPSGNPIPHDDGLLEELRAKVEEEAILREDFGEEFTAREDNR